MTGSHQGFCLHTNRSQARVDRVPSRPVGPIRVLKFWSTPLAQSFPCVGEEGGDVFLGQFLGWQHSGRPSHVPPLFLPIKTGGMRKKKGEGGKTERKKKKKTRRGRKEKENPKRKKGRKNRRRKKEKTERKTGENKGEETVHHHRQQRRLEPLPLVSTTVSLHKSHCMSVPRLSLLPSSPSLLCLPLLSFACRT